MIDLFSPLDIRKVHFKNRAVMAPMVLNCAVEDGSVTPAFQDFYAARARGGVGYIVLGATFVHNDGRGFGRQLGIDRDEMIPGLTGLASTIRQHARLGIQLSFKSVGRPPETFDLAQIRSYRQAFALAAVRARQAGFVDGSLGLDETLEIGHHLEAIGADYLSASAGIGLTQFRMSPPSDVPRGRQPGAVDCRGDRGGPRRRPEHRTLNGFPGRTFPGRSPKGIGRK